MNFSPLTAPSSYKKKCASHSPVSADFFAVWIRYVTTGGLLYCEGPFPHRVHTARPEIAII